MPPDQSPEGRAGTRTLPFPARERNELLPPLPPGERLVNRGPGETRWTPRPTRDVSDVIRSAKATRRDRQFPKFGVQRPVDESGRWKNSGSVEVHWPFFGEITQGFVLEALVLQKTTTAEQARAMPLACFKSKRRGERRIHPLLPHRIFPKKNQPNGCSFSWESQKGVHFILGEFSIDSMKPKF